MVRRLKEEERTLFSLGPCSLEELDGLKVNEDDRNLFSSYTQRPCSDLSTRSPACLLNERSFLSCANAGWVSNELSPRRSWLAHSLAARWTVLCTGPRLLAVIHMADLWLCVWKDRADRGSISGKNTLFSLMIEVCWFLIPAPPSHTSRIKFCSSAKGEDESVQESGSHYKAGDNNKEEVRSADSFPGTADR